MSQPLNAAAKDLTQLRDDVMAFLSYGKHEALRETPLLADYVREFHDNELRKAHQRMHDPRKADRELLCEQSEALGITICELLSDPSSSDATILDSCAKRAELQLRIKQMLP